MSWYSDLEDKAAGAFGKLSKLPSLVKAKLNAPAPKILQNTLGKLPKEEKFTQALAKTPKFEASFKNPVANTVANMALESTVNLPSNLMRSWGKTAGGFITKAPAKQQLGNIGELGLNLASAIPFGKAVGAFKGAVQAPTRQAISTAIKQGGKTGVKFGAGYGLGYGATGAMQENKSLKDILAESAKGAGTGALFGGVLGAGIPAAGSFKSALQNSLRNRRAGQITRETIPTHLLPDRKIFNAEQKLPTGFVPVGPSKNPFAYDRSGYDVRNVPGVVAKKQLPAQTVERGRLAPTLTDWRKGLGEALPRPGMSIEDVSNRNTRAINAVNATKNAKASEAFAKMPRGIKPKPIDPKRIIPDEVFNTEVGGRVFEELSAAKAGERQWVSTPDEIGSSGKMIGIPSTFPQWVPEEYRKTSLFKEVKDALLDATLPKSKPAQRLYDIVHNEIRSRSKLPLYDFDAYDAKRLARLATEKQTPKTAPISKTLLEKTPYKKDSLVKAIENSKIRSVPTITREEAKNAGLEAHYMAEQNKPGFDQSFAKWVADREVAKTKGYQSGAKIQVPKGKEQEIIEAVESGKKTPQTKQIRAEFDALFNEAKSAGMDIPYLKNYITHIWEQSPQEVRQVFKSAGQKFQFAKNREIPTYKEGIELGLTPKYTNPKQIVAHYAQKMNEVKANIAFLTDLKKKGFIVSAAEAKHAPGLVPINAPGIAKSTGRIDGETAIVGNYYASPEIAQKINQVFGGVPEGTLGTALGKTAKASSIFQDLSLSGGIPKTPMNAFTIAQMTKEALSGRVKSPLVSFFRSMSGEATKNFYEKNAGQIQKMQKMNVPISTTLDIDSLGKSGFFQKAFTGGGKGAFDKIKTAWNKSMNEPTFKRFMGQLQVNLFNDIEKKAISSGKTAQEAARIAAGAVKNFYGLTSTAKTAGRDPMMGNLVSTVFFAPKYREAMIKFWVNNLKAFRHPLSLENRANIKFNIGALALLAGYDYLNKNINGVHLWENPSGKEDKLLIPGENNTTVGVPYLSSIATIPRGIYRQGAMLAKGDIAGAGKDALQTYASGMIKPAADVLANSDYFGNEIYDEKTDLPSERFGKMGKYLATQYTGHPYVKAGISALGSDKTAPQILSEATELPFRFYKTDKLASGKFWDARNEAEPYYTRFRSLLKTDPAQAESFYNEHKDAIDTYKQLQPLYKQYSNLKEEGRQQEFGGMIQGMTGKNIPKTGDFLQGKQSSGGYNLAAYGYDFPKIKNTNSFEGALKLSEAKKKLQSLYFDEDVPEEVKTELFRQAGVPKKAVELSILAGDRIPTQQKARFVRQMMTGAKKEDIAVLLQTGVLKKSVVDAMYEQNLISGNQAMLLARIIKTYSAQKRTPTQKKAKKGKKMKTITIKPMKTNYKPQNITLKDLIKK